MKYTFTKEDISQIRTHLKSFSVTFALFFCLPYAIPSYIQGNNEIFDKIKKIKLNLKILKQKLTHLF